MSYNKDSDMDEIFKKLTFLMLAMFKNCLEDKLNF